MARNLFGKLFILLALASSTGCCAIADRWCNRRHCHDGCYNPCCAPANPCCCYPAGSAPAGNTGWNNPAPAQPAVCSPCNR